MLVAGKWTGAFAVHDGLAEVMNILWYHWRLGRRQSQKSLVKA